MSKRVLICDDSELMRHMIADVLTEDGWEVAGQASNGQEAIDVYHRVRPDVVTMDMVMPAFDGLHGLHGIMAIDPAARVVMVSAVNQTRSVAQAIRGGAYDFLVKPFLPEQLLQTLRGCASETTSAAINPTTTVRQPV